MKAIEAYLVKSGATLSKNTLTEINKAIEAAATIQSVLEDLKKGASSDSQDGDDDEGEDDAEKGLDLTDADNLAFVRKALVSGDKVNELALSVVNAKMRELGIKQ